MKATLYVATNGLSVWFSDDLGESLTRLQSDSGMYSGTQVWSLAHHPSLPDELIAGTEVGIYRLNRPTRRWTRLGFDVEKTLVTALAYAPENPKVILAGTQPGGLYKSDDGGASWRSLAVPMKPYLSISVVDGHIREPDEESGLIQHWTRVTQILFDPKRPSDVWAGVEIDAVWRSADGGETWERKAEGLVSEDIHGFARPITEPPILYATTNEGLHVSRDSGTTWSMNKIESPWQYVRAIAERADRKGVMFLTNGDGPPGAHGRLYRSRDFGKSWEDVRLPTQVDSTVFSIATHPADPNLIFAATSLGQLFRSTDGGESWVVLRRRLGEIRAITWMPN